MDSDLFYHRCIHWYLGNEKDCTKVWSGISKPVEWEHSTTYAGKRINHPKLIVPCCTYHHRGAGLNKRFNLYVALRRADLDELSRLYPKRDWHREFAGLCNEFDHLIFREIPICPLTDSFDSRSQLGF